MRSRSRLNANCRDCTRTCVQTRTRSCRCGPVAGMGTGTGDGMIPGGILVVQPNSNTCICKYNLTTYKI